MDLPKVTFLFLVVLVLIEQGLTLKCIKCNSTDIDSNCRTGARPNRGSKGRQICSGDKATCFIMVSEIQGETYFQRGCANTDDICDKNANSLLCLTCRYINCNYEYISIGNKQDVDENQQEDLKIPDPPSTETNVNDQGILYRSSKEFRKKEEIADNSEHSTEATPIIEKEQKVVDSKAANIKKIFVDYMDNLPANETLEQNIEESSFFQFGNKIPNKV